MLENRSFDHMLGSMTSVKNVDGVPNGAPYFNTYSNLTYSQTPSEARIVSPDPKHDLSDSLVQLGPDSQGRVMNGFVENYAQSYPELSASQYGEVMSYYPFDSLPCLHRLASEFIVCDRWFSSLPGPTWPNRLFAMTGTSLGKVTMPGGVMDLNVHWYDQATIFDRLNERGINWKVYFGDSSISLILVHQWEPQNAVRHRPMIEFFSDVKEVTEFPSFAWIEPAYLPPEENDYHPPHDVMNGEKLVADVYNAIRADEQIWNSSLLLILFDEHGGFYDHVSPPQAVPPDQHCDEWTFDRLGVRVPAMLVSPWVQNGVLSDTFDHTSLLKYLIDKWGLGPLGQRVAQANSFARVISSTCRTDTPAQIDRPTTLETQAPQIRKYTENEIAVMSLSRALESMAKEDAIIVEAPKELEQNAAWGEAKAAKERFMGFLKHKSFAINDSG